MLIHNSFAVQVYQTSDYEARKAAIAEFNAANRFRKRGIAIIPTKFGISFTTKFLNQVRRTVHDSLTCALAQHEQMHVSNISLLWRFALLCLSLETEKLGPLGGDADCFDLQAGALVNIYTDGTVLVTHGGVEMGQGLHTKIAQACAAFPPRRTRFSSFCCLP